jgi:hypothetical protein
MTLIERILTILTNGFTIIASGIAIYLFIFQRKTIENAFKVLINYSRQLTLTELSSKLERLNDLNASDDEGKIKVINILNEIRGQIRGNNKLKMQFAEILKDIEPYCTEVSAINEPVKRSLVSQMRELVRSYDLDSMNI